MNAFLRFPFGKLLVAVVAAVYLWALWIAFERRDLIADWLGEEGFFEIAPAFLYFVVGAAFLVMPYFQRRHKWMIGLLCLLMGSRELDIHEIVTEGGFLFFPPYFKANYPFAYEALEVAAVGFAILLVAAVFYLYAPVTRRNLMARDPQQFMMMAGWIALGVAIVLDGLVRKVADATGYILPAWAGTLATVMEEATEFLVPIFFLAGLLSFYQAWRSGRYRSNDPIYDIG